MTHRATDHRDQLAKAEAADRAEEIVHRLEDLLVEEVSAVDRAANRRRWLVTKRDGGTMTVGRANHEGAGEPGGAKWTVDVTKETDPKAGDPAPADADNGDGQGGKDAAEWDTAYINDLPDSAFLYVAPGGEKDADGKTTPRDLRYFPVRDSDGAIDLPHLRNALSRIPQADIPQEAKDTAQAEAEKLMAEAEGSEGTEGSEGSDGSDKDAGAGDADGGSAPEPGGVAKALSPILKAMGDNPEDKARDLLWMAMDEISRGALRSEEDTAAVTGLLEALRGAVMKAETPAGDGDGTDPASKGEAEVAEAVSLLQGALGKMATGEALDEEAHQAVARAVEILTGAGTDTGDTDGGSMGGEEASAGDREPANKAGAKMASANRKKFKDALGSLIKLFEDLIPESERGEWNKPAEKSGGDTPEATELAKAADREEALKAELAKAQEKLKAANVALAKAQDRPADSNVVNVDKGAGDPQGTTWEFDLNESDE